MIRNGSEFVLRKELMVKHVLGRIAFGAAMMAVMVGCSGSPSNPSSSSVATAATSSAAAASPSTEVPSSAAATAVPSEIASASSPTTSGDPCRLLTSAEAEAALGRAVQAPVRRDVSNLGLGNGFDCHYDSVDQSAGPASVHAGVLGDKVPRDQWEQAERQQADLQEVAGLGELAFFDKYRQAIDVFDHGRLVQVQIINSKRSSELLALLTDIARHAIERI